MERLCIPRLSRKVDKVLVVLPSKDDRDPNRRYSQKVIKPVFLSLSGGNLQCTSIHVFLGVGKRLASDSSGSGSVA